MTQVDAVRERLVAGLREMAETALRTADRIAPDLERAAEMVRATVARGGTLFFCGNGGSAADAQHMATEYVVRYMRNRRAYPAVAITTDTSLITAAGNDIGFDLIFARQVEALARPGDLLVIHRRGRARQGRRSARVLGA
jgi:D-sedoheptulose 7-phosphate isomerase